MSNAISQLGAMNTTEFEKNRASFGRFDNGKSGSPITIELGSCTMEELKQVGELLANGPDDQRVVIIGANSSCPQMVKWSLWSSEKAAQDRATKAALKKAGK